LTKSQTVKKWELFLRTSVDAHWCHLANTIEPSVLRWQCSLMSNYFNHVLFIVLCDCCDLLQGIVSECIFSETVPPGYVRLFSFNGRCFEVIGQRMSSSAAEFFILLR